METEKIVQKIGNKTQVFHGFAEHTSGKLYKHHLKRNSKGRIVSIKASQAASNNKNLGEYQQKKTKKRPRRSGRLRKKKRVDYAEE